MLHMRGKKGRPERHSAKILRVYTSHTRAILYAYLTSRHLVQRYHCVLVPYHDIPVLVVREYGGVHGGSVRVLYLPPVLML